MALLEVRSLRAGYEGIPVVFGVDLEVNEGEVVALLGSNGAGKTTMLRAISGMIKPMSGGIAFDGRQVGGVAAEKIARSGLIHVPQGRGIFPSLGVEESLRLAAAMARVPRGELAAGSSRSRSFGRKHNARPSSTRRWSPTGSDPATVSVDSESLRKWRIALACSCARRSS